MANTNCITVLTARGITEILSTGGSQAWRLDASHAAKYEYLVCVQNSKKDWGSQEAKHHHAFMVGRISGISRAPENPHRWIINISSYAEIDIPEQWDGNRNPVSYRNLKDIGIETNKLEFKAVPKFAPTSLNVEQAGDEYEDEEENVVKPLTLKEAKVGLALYFGVNEENIQITIQG
ncbi:hypothetical protein [Enterobacter hormaechei]|uniref:hypothetical protein n=1 Tax=Enterobacter hormaechei TaxID=158836 RepID=UPI00298D363C|nr:hypothetical protein [Enterobacter hormaechei]